MSGPARLGVRATRQRAALTELLDSSPGFRSAQDLHSELRERGESIGLTTVYRTLQTMAEQELVDVLRGESGEAFYRACAAPHHHHHLMCRECGLTVEVAGDAVEAWAHETGRAHGFTGLSHTVELFGLCRGCSTNRE